MLACFVWSDRSDRSNGSKTTSAGKGRSMLRRMFLRSSLLGTVLAMGVTAQAQAQQLTVGANFCNVRWDFQDEFGNIVGFEVDVVNEIGARLGREVVIENIPFNGLFSAVQSGRIDMATSSITITPERLQ